MLYKTSYLATAGFSNGQGILGVGSKQYFVDKIAYDNSLKLLKYILLAHTEKEIFTFCSKNKIDNKIFYQLLNHNLVVDESNFFNKMDNLSFKNKLYFNSLGLNANQLYDSFANTTFLIVGCGGIGNFISFSLASLNPKKLILLDGDTIEESNLNRQFLFSQKDIGKYKVDILKKQLLMRNPTLDIECQASYISLNKLQETINNLKNTNIFVVLSGDSFAALKITTKICVKNNIPFLNIGYLNDISAIGPFYIPKISSCPFCNNSLSIEDELSGKDTEIGKIEAILNKNNEAPSSFTNNAMSSSMGMADIIQYMAHRYDNINSLNKRVGINTATFEKYIIEVPKDERCEICSNEEK